MAATRLSRLQDRKDKRRLMLAVVGIFAVIVFVLLFGLKILVGFSVMVDSLRGTGTEVSQSQEFILPPTLDPPPHATNSASIFVTGIGEPDRTLIIYVNNREVKKLTVPKDGTFKAESIPLTEGQNAISAKQSDGKELFSELSNVILVLYGNTPPKLEVSSPLDDSVVSGDSNTVQVQGITDENITITINGRFVVVKGDSSFTYAYPLNEGDNILTILAVDDSGNQTEIKRKVQYHR